MKIVKGQICIAGPVRPDLEDKWNIAAAAKGLLLTGGKEARTEPKAVDLVVGPTGHHLDVGLAGAVSFSDREIGHLESAVKSIMYVDIGMGPQTIEVFFPKPVFLHGGKGNTVTLNPRKEVLDALAQR